MEIRIECDGSFTVNIDELNELHHFKTMTDQHYAELRNSITELGFSFPYFIWIDPEGKQWIVDAHQRTRALKRMREEGFIIPPLPAIRIFAKDKKEAAKKVIAAESRYADPSEGDFAQFLEDYAIDIGEVDSFMDIPDIDSDHWEVPSETTEDEPPAVDETNPPVSQLGEVYQLGRHRLMCGDATKIEDVEKLMGGQKADMVLTDPPYGMHLDIDFSQMGSIYGTSKNYGTPHDDRAKEEENTIIGDNQDYDPSHLFNMFPDVKEMFLWGADYYAERIPNKNKGSFFVWDKRVGIEDIQWSTSEFETCWSKAKHQRQLIRCKWFGSQGTETQDINNRIHPTQKPIQVNTYLINKFSQPEQLIVDLFGGSGSTLIACEQTNRVCYMMEIDPRYCDVIRKRYAKFIGQEEQWQEVTPSI